jgi:hypothetical protein
MLGGTCLRRCAWFVGGMRAVLGQWAGGSLPLPQAKAPSTVARLVIHVGPESYCQGSGSFALRGGVGCRNGRLHCWVCTPPRKNRRQSQKYKHTSLILLVGKFSDVRIYALSEVLHSPSSMRQGSLCVVLEISGLFCVLRLLAVFLSAFRHIALVKE